MKPTTEGVISLVAAFLVLFSAMCARGYRPPLPSLHWPVWESTSCPRDDARTGSPSIIEAQGD